jgi:hypothetical protein
MDATSILDMREKIAAHGFLIKYVLRGPTSRSFLYTIGLTDHNSPELLCILPHHGFAAEGVNHLQHLSQRILDGFPVVDGQVTAPELVHMAWACLVKEISDIDLNSYNENFIRRANQFYGRNLKVLQLEYFLTNLVGHALLLVPSGTQFQVQGQSRLKLDENCPEWIIENLLQKCYLCGKRDNSLIRCPRCNVAWYCCR